MKKKFINKVTLQGILYQHDLEEKVTGPNSKKPGTHYIAGSVDIATDDALTNIVTVYYSYVVPTTSSGGVNKTYVVLDNILNGTYKTYMDDPSNAVKVKVDTSIGLNEFYTDDKNTGEEVLVSQMRNIGGFISTIQYLATEDQRNEFRCDMIITRVAHTEANEETDTPEKVTIGGAIFDFRNQLLPVEFPVTIREGIDYFLSQDISNANPFVTQVSGSEINSTIVKKTVISSAFGGDEVKETKRTRREFLVTHSAAEPYVWDDESFLTAEDLTKCMADRETTLATLKKNRADYKARKATEASAFGATAPSASAVAATTVPEFKF